MHGENEFLMLDGALVSITWESERIPPSDRKIRVCRAGLKRTLLGLGMREKF